MSTEIHLESKHASSTSQYSKHVYQFKTSVQTVIWTFMGPVYYHYHHEYVFCMILDVIGICWNLDTKLYLN